MTQATAFPRLDDDDDDDDEDRPEEEPRRDKERQAPSSLGEKLLKARTVLIFGQINDRLARDTTAQLLALASDSDDDIRVLINSPGGHVESGDTIHDVIRFVTPTVKVIGTGWVASAGAHIFLGATRENRYCLPNTRFLLHQPMGGVRGPATDLDIEAHESLKMRERINQIIARETEQPIEQIRKQTDRNFWMSAEEAREYGVVTHIVETADQVK